VKTTPHSNMSKAGTALLMLSLAAGCGSVSAQTGQDGASGSSGDGSAGIGGAGTGGGGTGGGKTDAGRTDGSTGALGTPVDLATAANFVILAETGISTVPPSVITGNLGVYPNAAASITNFSLTADSTNVSSTSMQVIGMIYASDYTAPTPANLIAALGDMEAAYTDAAGRAPAVTELGAGSIGGMTLSPGVYQWSSGVLIPTDLTLHGDATAVWIFQIAQTLTLSSATKVTLTGGALAENVFWEVAGSVEIGTTAHIEGIILCKTMINLRTGASMVGRLYAQSAVTLESNTVTRPAP
jgi:hypothetical protein